jgi:hypothetical protein
MAWDSTRPVPWPRLMREWVVYVAIMALVFALFFRDSNLVGILAGLLASGPIFLFFGYAMAKFGYERKSLKQLRSEPRKPKRSGKGAAPSESDRSAPRPKPAPTRRTAGSGNRPSRPAKKRR